MTTHTTHTMRTKLGAILLAASVVAVAARPAAQSGSAAPDPVSGTWAGELAVQDASKPMAVTLTLKFDGKTTVTGTMTGLPAPGDVKTGTFTAKTGAMTLQLGKVGTPAVLITLTGDVAKDGFTGKVAGESAGTFKLARKKEQ